MTRSFADESTDNAFLATVVTALLIRAGGKALFTDKEWTAALEHESTLYVDRAGAKAPVSVILLSKEHKA